MQPAVRLADRPSTPALRDVLTLLKPLTWFPPMWAFLCGAVSAPGAVGRHWELLILGALLCGPFVCGASQAANDWYDRHVDALNEPNRPIPSGRIPGRWGLVIALIGSGASLALAAAMGGLLVLVATLAALACGWAYSMPPIRLKMSGLWGPGVTGLAYESLAWFTGAALLSGGGWPGWPTTILALVYGLGAHGIMTLNDFKAVEGDREMGIRSLPVVLGVDRAARVACVVMVVPQVAVIALLAAWGHALPATLVAAALAAQLGLMPRLLRDPLGQTPWYNATGTSLSVLGMMAAALGLGGVL
jgi:chlorophyll synthase